MIKQPFYQLADITAGDNYQKAQPPRKRDKKKDYIENKRY